MKPGTPPTAVSRRHPRRALVAALLLLGLPIGGTAAAPDAPSDAVRLGPGCYGFAEIADALSTPARPVRCAPAVRHRAAFVRLKDRPRPEAESLLAAALDVVLRPSADPTEQARGVRVLDADPATERRERAWRRRLAERLCADLNTQRADLEAALRVPPDRVTNRARSLEDEAKTLGERSRLLSSSERARWLALLRETSALLNVEEERNNPCRRAGRELLTGRITVAEIERALIDGHSLRVQPVAAALPPEALREVEAFSAKRFFAGEEPPRFDLAVSWWLLDRTTGQVRVNFSAELLAPGAGGSVSASAAIGGATLPLLDPMSSGADPAEDPEDKDPAGLLDRELTAQLFLGVPASSDGGAAVPPALGGDAPAWLRAEREKTERFLAGDPRAKASLSGPKGDPGSWQADSLSEVLARWSALHDAETVMELWPLSEHRNRPEADSLAAALMPTDPWTLEARDGVLLVRSQMAFLDRPRRTPTAALAGLLTSMAARRAERPPERGGTRSYRRMTYVEMVAYVAASRDEGTWRAAGWPTSAYHGLFLPELDNAAPGLFVWERMSFGQRRELLRGERARFPLAHLPPAALDALAAMLARRFGPTEVALLRPDARDALALCEMGHDLSLHRGKSWLSLSQMTTSLTWTAAPGGERR